MINKHLLADYDMTGCYQRMKLPYWEANASKRAYTLSSIYCTLDAILQNQANLHAAALTLNDLVDAKKYIFRRHWRIEILANNSIKPVVLDIRRSWAHQTSDHAIAKSEWDMFSKHLRHSHIKLHERYLEDKTPDIYMANKKDGLLWANTHRYLILYLFRQFIYSRMTQAATAVCPAVHQ